jgi:hypothetical protein
MDELQISGRRFISSRRIAKENGYHTDYIGQLIRGGKIKGQKVGRTWYVDAETFDAYLGQSPAQPTGSGYADSSADESAEVLAPSSSQPPSPVVVPVSAGQTFSQQVPTPVETPVEAPVEVKVEIKKVEEKKEEVSVAVRKIETKPQKTIVVSRGITTPTGLRYIQDDEPLLPEIAPEQNITKVMPRQEELEPAPIFEAPVQSSARSAKGLLVGLAIVGVVMFVASAVVSSALTQTINVKAGSPASVSYTLHW